MTTLHLTDFDLVRQLHAGDEGVLESILRLHGPAVLGLLKQRFGGLLVEHDFEDVLAMSLFRVWQHRQNYDSDKASLRVWLFRIAANLCRDILKYGWQKARQLEVADVGQLSNAVATEYPAADDDEIITEREPRIENSFESAHHVQATDSSVDSTVNTRIDAGSSSSSQSHNDQQIVNELRQILHGLPDAQRRILLADAASPDGKVSSQDLSNELGIPASTVRVYRRRAIQHLRQEMDRRGIRRESKND